MLRIAIIGAGLAGTTLASSLADKADVKVFEKSRGIGGRMATRYAGIFEFDHGAQYFTARTPAFQDALQPLLTGGQVAEWPGKIVTLTAGKTASETEKTDPIYVAKPRMNVLPKAMASDLDVVTKCQINELVRDQDGIWTLSDNEGNVHGPFDWVVSTAPHVQTAALFPEAVSFADVLARTKMSGCFSVLLGFDDRPPVDWSGAKVEGSPLGWIGINSDKPGRETSPSIVIQTTNDWAEANLERDPDEVSGLLTDELRTLTGIDVSTSKHMSLHRWRYAHTPNAAGEACLLDPSMNLAACGDWCLGGRVECAFTSARALAEALPV